jgi:rhamnosyltransferase
MMSNKYKVNTWNMNQQTKLKVAVLMATYNGLQSIDEQVASILNQYDINLSLHISDNASTDGTKMWLEKLALKNNNITVLPHDAYLAGAGKNFFRLIKDVDLTGFDYIAFADQDDIWKSDKLIRHVKLAKLHNADGVSSNVMAFWPDGKEKLLDKAQPQRALDYLFESAGPGCTFLMTTWLVHKVREQLLDENSPAKDMALHDWLTYAICRAHGRKWIIDSHPSVRYRQHANNVFGANVGFKAKLTRLQKLRQGWYRKEVAKIAQVCNRIAPSNETNELLVLLNSNSYFFQLQLLSFIPEARRRLVDRCLLALSIVVGLF